MSTPLSHEITRLLRAWSKGEADALEKLTPLVYGELHRLARRYMAEERSGRTLQTTALVNEAYLRLAGSRQTDWRDRAYFFGACARIMRRILVDCARSRKSVKRDAGFQVELDGDVVASSSAETDLAAVDDALEALAAIEPRWARVVELRFFGGLSVQQTGEVLGISAETVMRDWKAAKSWLKKELLPETADGR
jgi:RNA polymerase sigma-70 factor (ECF subfamily)